MNVEKFIGSDMREVMAKVRKTLGNDAVIISSRRIGDQTEISASSEYARDNKITSTVDNSAAASTSLDVKQASETESSIQDINDELGKLRKLFEGELAQLAWRDISVQQPGKYSLITRLENEGFNKDIATKIVSRALPCDDVDQGWRKTLSILNKLIRPVEEDIMENGGVIALIGSTGVGKTTTAAKLAAQFALLHGRKHVAFVTTDNLKVGGQEQLISYGSLLGIPVQVANGPEELQRTLDSLSERKLVIIDTAGMSQRDVALAEQFKSLQNNEVNIQPWLVLSATAQDRVQSDVIRAFSAVKPTAVVITKTDESEQMGPVLSGVIRRKLPIAFISDGQKVPDNLQPLDNNVLLGELGMANAQDYSSETGNIESLAQPGNVENRNQEIAVGG